MKRVHKVLAAAREVLTNDQLEDIATRLKWNVIEVVEVLEEAELLEEENDGNCKRIIHT